MWIDLGQKGVLESGDNEDDTALSYNALFSTRISMNNVPTFFLGSHNTFTSSQSNSQKPTIIPYQYPTKQ